MKSKIVKVNPIIIINNDGSYSITYPIIISDSQTDYKIECINLDPDEIERRIKEQGIKEEDNE